MILSGIILVDPEEYFTVTLINSTLFYPTVNSELHAVYYRFLFEEAPNISDVASNASKAERHLLA
jgi:hypothetical protein